MSGFEEWKHSGLNDERKAVVLVAEGLANVSNVNLRWWQRKRHPMDFIPIAREVVAILLLLPDGRDLCRRILDDHDGRFWLYDAP